MIKDEIAGWYHGLNRHEFGQTVRDSEGQVRLPTLQTSAAFYGFTKSDMI